MAETYDINALKAKYLGTSAPAGGGAFSAPQGQQYDVEALRQKYLGSTAPQTPTLTPEQQKDKESADKYGSSFASQIGEGTVSSLAKMVGNVPSSAWNFAKGALEIVNPINTVKNIKDIVEGVPEIYRNSKYTGGAFKTTADLGLDVAKSAYEGLVPEAARNTLAGDLGGAGRTVTNDPVGQVLPFIFAAKGGAKYADNRTSKANMADYVENIQENTKNRVPIPQPSTKYSDMVDKGISTVTDPVVNATKTVFGKTGEMIGNTVRYGTSQATGLSPDTITQIGKTPEVFTKEGMSQIDRPSLGRAVKSELDKRIADLEETGKAYGPIRESDTQVKVDRNFIENVMQEIAGVKVEKGKVQTSGSAKVRDNRDVRALQHIYDLWKPSFKKGAISAEEFLNFRSDLAKLAKFERDVGKSADIEGATSRMRARLNESYRPQLDGLDLLDEQFGPMKNELKTLSKGLTDKDGNLSDAAINRISNATGKGKDQMLSRLEEIVPGITERIQILKAVEDIQHATGQKVGAYFRPVPIVGGFAVGGPIGAAISAILLSPGNAVSIIRRYGLMKNSEAVKTIMHALSTGAQNTKDALQNKPGAFNPRFKLPEGSVGGMSVQNIYEGKANYSNKNGVALTQIPNEKLTTAELKQKLFMLDDGALQKKSPDLYKKMVDAIQERGTFRVEKSEKKVELETESPQDTQLFHTTTPDAAKAIRSEGFRTDLSPEDQIGRAFGDGVYFSTTKAEAEAWKQFVTGKDGKGEIIDITTKLNIFDPKTDSPAIYWDKLAKKAGIKSNPELGQEIADAYMMGKEAMEPDVYSDAIARSQLIIKTLQEKGVDGAKFVEPIDASEGIQNPQVVVFNVEKANEALKSGNKKGAFSPR